MNTVILKVEDNEFHGTVVDCNYDNDVSEFILELDVHFYTQSQCIKIAKSIISKMCSCTLVCSPAHYIFDSIIQKCEWDLNKGNMVLCTKGCGEPQMHLNGEII